MQLNIYQNNKKIEHLQAKDRNKTKLKTAIGVKFDHFSLQASILLLSAFLTKRKPKNSQKGELLLTSIYCFDTFV